MKEVLKIALKEFGTLILVLVAIALVWPWIWLWKIPISILTVGAIYTISKPFYDYRSRPWGERLYRVGRWILNVLYQTWIVISKAFLFIAYTIDLYANVLLGELIEDLVTAEEYTLFGLGDVTISAALGELKYRGRLNNTGLFLCKILSAVDLKHKDHCLAAYELYKFKMNQK